MKNLLLLILLFFTAFANAQTGKISGIVTDKDNGEILIFATVMVTQNDVFIAGMQTDFDGKFSFDNLEVGAYDIEIRYVGYPKEQIKKIKVKAEETTILKLTMKSQTDCCCVIIGFEPPMIDVFDLTQGTTFSIKEVQRSPHKN